MLARPKRFELLTPRFVVWCSIQLSYGRLPSSWSMIVSEDRVPFFGIMLLGPPRNAGADARYSYSLHRILARAADRGASSPRPRAAMGVELDRAVGDGELERRPDRALHQLDLAAVGANEFGGDDEA